MKIDEMSAKLSFLKDLRDKTARGECDDEISDTRENVVAELGKLIIEGEKILEDWAVSTTVRN